LIAAVAILLSVLTPRLRQYQRERRVRQANQQLLQSALRGELEGIAEAIAAGADLNVFDTKCFTALGYAIAAGNVPMTNLLISAGANPDAVFGSPARTPLAIAVRDDDFALATRLLEAGADPAGEAQLGFCVENGRIEMMELLLNHGAAPNARSLHAAIACDHSEGVRFAMIRLLIDHGADVHAEMGGCNAMDIAVRHSDGRVGDLLRQYGATYTAREAAAFNRLDEIKQIVGHRPEVLTERFNPVYYAEPGQELTLLGIALERGYRELAMFLLDAGAPLDTLEYYGWTPLHMAVHGGDPELVRLLIARGLDVNARGDAGETPLMQSARQGRAEAAAALIESGADVNVRNGVGSTAMHSAVFYKHDDIVRMLLAAGADPSIADREGRTAIDLARTTNKVVLPILEKALPAELSQ
jgi:ankyrin repeat protein